MPEMTTPIDVETVATSAIDRYKQPLTILAPMVKAGTLALRLLALDHGADLVYTEEVIDFKMLRTKRFVNDSTGQIEYRCGDGETPAFQTCARERNHVVFQIGTNDARRAEHDVFAVDINMGCPKPFSIKGGMGAALLSQPAKIRDILTTLVQNVCIPVTCKIRVLESEEKTMELCEMIQSCGVAAIGVHGRTRDERQQHENRDALIARIQTRLRIPVIANGGSNTLRTNADVSAWRARTGCRSVMIARAALCNPMIFSSTAVYDRQTIIKQYLIHCASTCARFENTKYTVQRMLEGEQQTSECGRRLLAAATLTEIFDIWNIPIPASCVASIEPSTTTMKSRKRANSQSECELFEQNKIDLLMDINVPIKRLKCAENSPKSVLYEYCRDNEIKEMPKYETMPGAGDRGRQYVSIVTVGGKQYGSSRFHVNKKLAEQAAALVALHGLNIRSMLAGDWEST